MSNAQLLTARALGEMLINGDPDGRLVLTVRVKDRGGDLVAVDELYPEDVAVSFKFAQHTDEGDKDTLRLDLFLTGVD